VLVFPEDACQEAALDADAGGRDAPQHIRLVQLSGQICRAGMYGKKGIEQ
jgi:hypothetical protein